ncbi:MAG: hypothetical protein HY673_09295 [Chloroflexi bacterium]|nr:hypothetical protein [Chloroflexota bacterium]
MFYVPSYAWWLVLGSGVAALTACLLLLLSSEQSGRSNTRAGRATFPLLCAASGIGLYFLEHLSA